jgi:endo-1,4-beta-D-glucanase Y
MSGPQYRWARVRRMLYWATLAISIVQGGCRSAQSQPMTQAMWPLWKVYSAHFIDASGRVIEHGNADRTTSEGQAYAMFFSLVANDRPQFDKLLVWTTENLAQGDLTAHLPAWEWGHAADGSWRVLDKNSAADADLWMSYALMEAGRLWREPRYRSLGIALASLIAVQEVKDLPGLGPTLLPATTGFSAGNHWILNPSYSPLPVLTGMAHAMPQGPWRAMASGLPTLLQRSSVHGFALDWVSYRVADGFTPAVLPGAAKDAAPIGSYDAIRVYLWAGIAPRSMAGAKAVLNAVPGMYMYLANHPIPQLVVNAAGTVANADGGVGFSAAVLPYLTAYGAKGPAAQQQNRMDALVDPKTGLYGAQPLYYDQNLALFAEGWQQKLYRFSARGELQLSWRDSKIGN